MNNSKLIDCLSELGNQISGYLMGNKQISNYDLLSDSVRKAQYSNPWFIESFINLSLQNIAHQLQKPNLENWAIHVKMPNQSKRIALIMAGNIPLVGFHDLLSVIMAGHQAVVKLSSKDSVLMPAIKQILVTIDSEFEKLIQFESNLMKNFDAIIATGSNNSAKHFEYYFGKYPNIIRRNRNSVAIIHPTDDENILSQIANDVLFYFGLGCRSVSKLYLPIGFDLEKMVQSFNDFEQLAQNFKYFNNYEYNKSIFLINGVKHYDNGFLLFKEDDSFISPVAVLHFEFYTDLEQLKQNLSFYKGQLQCIVSSQLEGNQYVKPGKTQFPGLNDWADDVNVLDFLQKIS